MSDTDALPAPPGRERRVLPVAAVVAVLAVVLSGGYIVAGALAEPAGPPITVASVLRISPLSGWQLAQRFGDPPGARLTRGSGNLDVAAVPFGGDADDLLRGYVDDVLEPQASQLSLSAVEHVSLGSGLRGSRVSFVGTFGDVHSPIEGQISAVVSPTGVGAVFDGWAPSGLLRYVLDDIERMVAGAEVS